MRSTRLRRSAALLGPALMIALAGCASFTEGRLPERDLAAIEREGKLPAITYQFAQGSTVGTLETLDSAATSPAIVVPNTILQSRVEPIFRRVFVEAVATTEPGEWHVDMYYRETPRHQGVTMTLVFFFVCSLGIVPAYAQDELYLEAKLRHGGETVRQWVFEEDVSTWMHWFVLPWAFTNDPMERKTELVDNMVLNLVHELRGALPADAAVPAETGGAPPQARAAASPASTQLR